MEFEERMDDAITEILLDVYNRLRNTDPEFDEKIRQITELSELEHIFKEKLTEDEYENHEKMVALQQEVDNRIQQEAYLQGAKDCAILLKKLGIL